MTVERKSTVATPRQSARCGIGLIRSAIFTPSPREAQ